MDKFDISGFPAEHLDRIWDDVIPFVESGLLYGIGEFLPEDIRHHLKEGQMQLWVAADALKLKGIVITEFLTFPRTNVCQVVLVAGTAIEKWDYCLDVIEDWALSQGVECVRAFGRPGWKPRAKEHGYAMTHCVYSKFLRANHENTH